MKRLIPIILASALLLTGCPGNDKPTDSDTPAETTSAVTEPSETEAAEQTGAGGQTASGTKKSAASKTTTAAGTTAKQAAGTDAQVQDELPVIEDDRAEPVPADQDEPEDLNPFDNEDGVIELPVIPIR